MADFLQNVGAMTLVFGALYLAYLGVRSHMRKAKDDYR